MRFPRSSVDRGAWRSQFRSGLPPSSSARRPMTLSNCLRRSLVCCALVIACIPRALAAQAQIETLTGTVHGDSGSVVNNALITVTPAGAGATASVTARSNTAGKWTIVMTARAGEYYVTVSAIGWIQQRLDLK